MHPADLCNVACVVCWEECQAGLIIPPLLPMGLVQGCLVTWRGSVNAGITILRSAGRPCNMWGLLGTLAQGLVLNAAAAHKEGSGAMAS